jgi:hypothetical protein
LHLSRSICNICRYLLQGASLEEAQLQGASLEFAHLQGAWLGGAQLQGASLEGAQLQGASLESAHLQGASLYGAQLQGASLGESDLTAANLDAAFLWRADFDTAKLKSLSARDLHWVVEKDLHGVAEKRKEDVEIYPWSEKDYLNLKQNMERHIPAGDARTEALKRIEILDCEKTNDGLAPCDPKAVPPPIAKDINKAAVDEQAYAKALAASLGELVCDSGSDAIYILRGWLRSEVLIKGRLGMLIDSRIRATGTEAAKLVERIQSKDCPVSTALTEKDKAELRAAQEPSEKAVYRAKIMK